MIKKIAFTKRYLKYLINSKHYKGHGIHSPFIFDFTQNVIFSNKNHALFDKILTIAADFEKDNKQIQISDSGAGSRVFKGNKRRIKDIAKVSSTRIKYGKLLFRMVEYLHFENILELGTSLGVGTLYLASAKKANVFTIEGDKAIYKIAKNTFEQAGLTNINSINSLFDKSLPEVLSKMPSIDLVYFDGNHKLEPTLKYFEQCLANINNNSIFVFDDIHWSMEMEQAWDKIKRHPQTKVTIDLFQMGIVFFRKELSKEHFVIKFL